MVFAVESAENRWPAVYKRAWKGHSMSKHQFHTYFEAAVDTDAWPLFTTGPDGGEITRITHKVTGSSTPTVDFNLEKRDENDPFSAGADIWSSDKTANTTSTSETSFDAATLAARQSVWFTASAKSGTVDKVMISGEWQDPKITITVTTPGKLDYAGGIATIVIAAVTMDVQPSEAGKIDYVGTRVEPLAGNLRRRFAAHAPMRRRPRLPRVVDVRNTPPVGLWNS